MKRFRSTEFTVGTFALLGLMIIIYMSLKVNDRGVVGGASHYYHAYFTSVSGLVEKVPVEVAGIPAGYVNAIELEGPRAKVVLRIRGDISIHEDASLTVRDRGMLGDRYIALDLGTPTFPLIPNNGEIKSTYSRSDLEQITSALSKTTKIIDRLLTSDDPGGALGDTIVNLRDTTSKLKDLVGENQDRIGSILTHMEKFSANLNEITDENKEQIHTVLVTLEDVAKSLKTALGSDGNFNKSMASIQRITEKVERGEGTVGKLLNDETTINNINEAAEGLKETLGLYRKFKLQIDYRGEFLMDAKEMQHLVGFSLHPAPDKFIAFELVDAPLGETNVTDTTVTSNGAVLSSTETIQTSDSVLFSLFLGKRFWDLTFRFGFIRSKGGAGLDYHLFKDKLVLSAEVFDFSRPGDRAHMRAYGTIYLYKHLLLTGGADDVLTKNGARNYFFGAGLRFNDEDLKALATTLAGSAF